MQKEIDLLSFLSRVTEKNTKHYRSDFLYDSRKLQEAAQAAAPGGTPFFLDEQTKRNMVRFGTRGVYPRQQRA